MTARKQIGLRERQDRVYVRRKSLDYQTSGRSIRPKCAARERGNTDIVSSFFPVQAVFAATEGQHVRGALGFGLSGVTAKTHTRCSSAAVYARLPGASPLIAEAPAPASCSLRCSKIDPVAARIGAMHWAFGCE